MTEQEGAVKDIFVVVGRPTNADDWLVITAGADHPSGAHYSYTGALAAQAAALGSPDNYFEVTILGAGSGVYRD